MTCAGGCDRNAHTACQSRNKQWYSLNSEKSSLSVTHFLNQEKKQLLSVLNNLLQVSPPGGSGEWLRSFPKAHSTGSNSFPCSRTHEILTVPSISWEKTVKNLWLVRHPLRKTPPLSKVFIYTRDTRALMAAFKSILYPKMINSPWGQALLASQQCQGTRMRLCFSEA